MHLTCFLFRFLSVSHTSTLSHHPHTSKRPPTPFFFFEFRPESAGSAPVSVCIGGFTRSGLSLSRVGESRKKKRKWTWHRRARAAAVLPRPCILVRHSVFCVSSSSHYSFLTWHELGMHYNFIRPDLIVGSYLQTPEDVDKLCSVGVKTIFCLQQNSDLEYLGVDINGIREYAKTYDDIQHLRAEIREFDAFDLRVRLPAVVSKLHKAINRNGGVTYVHCTAGLGRAPAVTLAYMFWVQGYKLMEAYNLLMSKRSCLPKLDAIKSATADVLTSFRKKVVTLTWKNLDCSTVEISGLDIGWGQKIPLQFDEEQGLWILRRELAEGRYEYKYIVDGEWTINENELITSANKDGHVNNFVQVSDDNPDSVNANLRKRLTGDNPDLSKDERLKIRQFLESIPDEGQ